MKNFLKISFAASIILSTIVFSQPCFADNAGHKLLRGVGNILTGWLEIPMNIYNTSVEENAFVGMTVGLAKGVGMTVARTCVGAYETITFPFPIPEDYRPILDPEYVFQTEE